MDTYTLGLSGSLIWLILFVLIFVGFTIFSYQRTNPQIANSKRFLLIALRSLGLSLLIIALFEPVITAVRSKKAEPKIAILLDNSISMSLNDAAGNRKEVYKNAFQNSNVEGIDNNMQYTFLFDSEIKSTKKIAFDSIKFSGDFTDISNSLINISNIAENDNIQSVILFTDGAINKGNNPIYDAEKLGKPVYVIGIGDTNSPKDLIVSTIITNDIAYIDNNLPVNVNFNVNGFENGEIKIKIKDNEKIIKEKSITIEKNKSDYSLIFDYTPKEAGTRKISISVDNLPNEITYKNNNLSKYIKVLKNKRKASIFAGYASPDVSFLKQALSKQKGLEVAEYIQKIGSEFYTNPTDQDLAESEVIFLVGFPISATPDNLIEKIILQLKQGKPVMFIAGQYTDYQKLRKLEEFLPFNTASSQNREFEAIPDFYPTSLSNPVVRINGTEEDLKLWNNLPPLFRTETFVRSKPESDLLAGFRINNVPMKEPLIMTRQIQNKKSIAVIGYGLYKWKLAGYAAEISKGRENTQDLYSKFIENSLRWLSVSDQSKRIKIQPSKENFTNNEKIEFNAQVYDAAFSPIDNASVLLKVKTKEGDRELSLTSIGNGRYYGFIDKLSEGDYLFNGEVIVSGKKIGSDEGRFAVGGITAEYKDLKMNIELLKQIAKLSGGKFYLPGEVGQLMNDLKNHQGFKPKILTSKDDISVWNNPWLMIISVICLSFEWFIRKRAGMV